MSQSYATLYGLPLSGLRFFTVYGPWGRPDMAYYGFAQKILLGQPSEVFGEGRMARAFSYIDDIVDGVVGVLDRPARQSVVQGKSELVRVEPGGGRYLKQKITT